jgi:hypothetical protein
MNILRRKTGVYFAMEGDKGSIKSQYASISNPFNDEEMEFYFEQFKENYYDDYIKIIEYSGNDQEEYNSLFSRLAVHVMRIMIDLYGEDVFEDPRQNTIMSKILRDMIKLVINDRRI